MYRFFYFFSLKSYSFISFHFISFVNSNVRKVGIYHHVRFNISSSIFIMDNFIIILNVKKIWKSYQKFKQEKMWKNFLIHSGSSHAWSDKQKKEKHMNFTHLNLNLNSSIKKLPISHAMLTLNRIWIPVLMVTDSSRSLLHLSQWNISHIAFK